MIVTLEHNDLVAEICEKEFNCLPPHPNYGEVVAAIEDGQLKAFMSRELLAHVGTVWVNPLDRGTAKGASWLKRLIKQFVVEMPAGSSAVVVDEPGRYGDLLKFIGMQEKPGTLYRIDF